jgi:two-component system, NarL family, sensor histidine kinase DegS
METLRRDQFPHRAIAVFYARLSLDALGIIFLLIPSWIKIGSPVLKKALFLYIFLLIGHVVSYSLIGKKGDRIVYFITLCLDIVALCFLIVITGGLASPLMSGHLLYAVFFVILYPHPLAILPPLLLLPAIAKISQLMGTEVPLRDLLLLLWYSALDLIIVLTIVYFDLQENLRFRNAMSIEAERRQLSIIEERQRMAREMHDGLGATLSAIKIQSEFLAELCIGVDDELEEESKELHSRTYMALNELRRTVMLMREDFDLFTSLDELVMNMSSIWKYRVFFDSSLTTLMIPKVLHLHIYRIIQETLTNTGKHADAEIVNITLEEKRKTPKWVGEKKKETGIELCIEDDGDGFSEKDKKEGHYGLIHLSERACEMGGKCKIKSKTGKGTTIKLWFPI